MKAKTQMLRRADFKTGFTLTELLVVILIIVVLASIGFPVMSRLKQNSTKTQCLNKLKNWGIAMAGYSSERDGKVNWEHWPSIGNDPTSYSPYIPYWTGDSDDRTGFETQLTQRNCPAIPWDRSKGNSPVSYATIRPTGINGVGISGRQAGKSSDYSLSLIKRPSRFMLMIDAMGASSYNISTAGDFTTRVRPLTINGPNLRHMNSVNALMADFSVKDMKWEEIQAGLSYWTTF